MRQKHPILRLFWLAALIGLIVSPVGGVNAASPATDLLQEEEARFYRITIENLTDSQPFSPPVALTHASGTALFHVEDDASPALGIMARSGDTSAILDLLEGDEGTTSIIGLDTPVLPSGQLATLDGVDLGDSVTFIIVAAPGDFLSLAMMLICTNDGFTGLDSAQLPVDGEEIVLELNAFDAGVEENTEASTDLPDGCSTLGPVPLDGDPNGNVDDVSVSTDPAGTILPHPGIAATADLLDAHNWSEPVARVSIIESDDIAVEEPLPPLPRYLVEITNLTAGQPFAPFVAVTHAADVSLFQPGDVASPELAELAQTGEPAPLLSLIDSLESGVTDADATPPLTPAGTVVELNDGVFSDRVVFEITAAEGDFLSLAGMLACTNDGFTGLNAAVLPAEGAITFVMRSYDAGVEENTELSLDLTDGCSALGIEALADDPDGNVDDGDLLTDPVGVIVRHPGIGGEGDLDPAVFGWEEPVALVIIERIVDEEPIVVLPGAGLMTVESTQSFDETVASLQAELEARGLNIIAVIDHAAGAASVDLELLPTTLILTGNPALGTPLMQSERSVAIDLPQKFLVWEDEEGIVYITYNDPDYLGLRHLLLDQEEILTNISNALSSLADVAAGLLEGQDMEESEAAEEPAAIGPRVIVNGQELVDESVVIQEVISDGPGWMAIHADAEGDIGAVIGFAPLLEGLNENVVVQILVDDATPVLYAMLHIDAGEVGVYEFPGPDTPFEENGFVVAPRFEVTGLE